MKLMMYEEYGLTEHEVAKVMKYVAVQYSEERMQREVIYSCAGSVKEKLFCAMFVGMITGIETQAYEPSTAAGLELALRMHNEKLVRRIASDIADEVGCPRVPVEEALIEVMHDRRVVLRGIRNDWSVWKHFVYGFVVGVSLQAFDVRLIRWLKDFFDAVLVLNDDDVVHVIRRVKSELFESRVRDVV